MSHSEELVFGHTVDGLFRVALRGKLPAAALEQFKAEGIDLSRPTAPAYPEANYHRCVEIAAAAVYPDLPREEALHRVGGAVVRGYEHAMLGKAVLGMMRILGPRRTLERMTANFKSATTYLETKVTRRSDTALELWLNKTSGMPTYFEGILHTVVTASGGQGAKVEHLGTDATGSRFLVSWA